MGRAQREERPSALHLRSEHETCGSDPDLSDAHACGSKKVERGIENIRRGLRMVLQTAEQSLGRSTWNLLVGYIIAQITQKPWSSPGAFPALAGP